MLRARREDQEIWRPHDAATDVARKVQLKTNPINGLPQIDEVEPPTAPPSAVPLPSEPLLSEPLLVKLGRSRADLVDRLGIPEDVADQAMTAPDEAAILTLAERHEGWLGLLLVDVATTDSIDAIIARLELARPPEPSGDQDADLLRSLRQPAAATQFSFIEDQEELRAVIERGDFGAWQVFLHPEQRKYVEKHYNGPFRLSGGAGTGKTVVLVHRARALARRNPAARIVLTTFTRNLANALRDSLAQLDPRVRQTATLGEPGVYVTGVDALAAAVIRSAGPDMATGVREVLGEDRSNPNGRTPSAQWRSILNSATPTLPPEIANETFLAEEYALVVLPNRIKNEAEYLRVRRPGRGVALDRTKRAAVWSLIAAYRAQTRIDGTLDFAEAAAVAAAFLQSTDGHAHHLADHVLVDEGQDLSPAHWQLLRAIAANEPDDLFLAEDSHQRIYGPRTVLSRYGIRIVGRSQRLTLNYRTTAQNLRYAMTVLDGADYVDLEEEPESTGYRSARSGPAPNRVTSPSLTDELEVIGRTVQRWIDDGTAPGTIAVLARDKFHCERIANGLAERDVPARLVDRDKPPIDRVLVMTMHRAKGMEFAKVVLADVGAPTAAEQARVAQLDEADQRDAQLRSRSLVYVAATRARDELTVVERV